jgi:hypothetical protein
MYHVSADPIDMPSHKNKPKCGELEGRRPLSTPTPYIVEYALSLEDEEEVEDDDHK